MVGFSFKRVSYADRNLLLWVPIVLVVGILLTLGESANAEAPCALCEMRAQQATLSQLASSQPPDRVALEDHIDALIDYATIGSAVLPTTWPTLPAVDQARFVALLRQVVRHVYARDILAVRACTLHFLGQRMSSDMAILDLEAHCPPGSGPGARVQLILTKRTKGWRVRDLLVEGDSVVRSWSRQFEKIVRHDSFSALLEKLSDRLADGQQP